MRRWTAPLYGVIALATFGYSAQSYQRDAWARYSVCSSVETSAVAVIGSDCRAPWPVDAPIVGLVSAIAWPLYWSWTAVAAVQESEA